MNAHRHAHIYTITEKNMYNTKSKPRPETNQRRRRGLDHDQDKYNKNYVFSIVSTIYVRLVVNGPLDGFWVSIITGGNQD